MDPTTTYKVPMAITTGKVNPILKSDHHHQGAASTSSAGASSPPSGAAQGKGADGKSTPERDKKHLTWDEHAIEEHDLLRGTRMKIDEPNTPYTHYDHHSDEESNSSGRHPRSPDENHPGNAAPSLATHWNDVSFKLQAVADKRDAAPLSPAPSRDSNMSDSENDAREKKDHAKKFKDMRKKHYNEIEEMKMWRAEHANDDDDGDDDNKMEE